MYFKEYSGFNCFPSSETFSKSSQLNARTKGVHSLEIPGAEVLLQINQQVLAVGREPWLPANGSGRRGNNSSLVCLQNISQINNNSF